MKKWVLAIFLVFFIMLGMLPGTAWAAEVNSGTCGADGDNLTWSLDSDGTLTISGTGKMADYGISDEAELAPPWYKERSSIKSAVIVNGVVSIGDSAFEGCNNLANVTIPDSVTSIEYYAFADCSSLTSVTIPSSVTAIREYAFVRCNSLTTINIPNSVTRIEDSAFAECKSLISVTIPDSVTEIEGNVFVFCDQLTTVLVDTGNTSYTAQDNVLFNKDMTELIGYPAGNVKTSYSIPDSVTSIGEYAFADCNRLTSVIIPDSVTSIRDSAFNYCNSLTSITIPDSVTKIEGNVFASCEQLTTVLVGTENTSYTAQDNVLFNKDMTELIGYPAGNVKEPLIKSR